MIPPVKQIIKKAKSQKFDVNNSACALFHIMANVGGVVGLLTRNSIIDIDELEQVDPSESFNFLNFLPEKTQEKLKEIAQNHLIVASFMTNSSLKHDKGEWHIVCSSYYKMRIKTILNHVDQNYLKKNHRRKDEITHFHFK
jgi:hypothetical protein